ncbi:MAG: prepilin peptidase, partial [Ruminococcus sp.]|nr:prepilin peptidase [Ruminococcus sp.]
MGEFKDMLHDEFVSPLFVISFYTVIFLLGISVGSFLNVVILRLPRNESLIKRSSHCMTCGAKIRARDLIPVFSWIALKGKCHSCGEKISPRYPVVESLNGLLFVLTFFVHDINAESIITCVLMSLLVVVGFMDWDTMEIDETILSLIAILVIPSLIFTNQASVEQRIIGSLII